MMTSDLNERAPDTDLWRLVNEGSASAFEILVRRHQSLVCAIAYSACGDLALSEDVAQETFWAAWRGRASLAEPGRLRSWLCGIARNLGKNAHRRASRPAEAPAAPLDAAGDLSTAAPGPAEEAVSREEETLVWETLERIPESYREPLVLFYREEHSVAEVAAALGLSEDAVKQRLSRGREMLRDRVTGVVAAALRRSRPGRAFTVAVMTGLTALSAGAKTALAGTGVAASGATLQSAAMGGILGGILGPLVGLLGGWFGTWVSAEAAPTRRERNYLRQTGRRMLLVSLLFTAVLVGLMLAFARRMPLGYSLISLAVWMAAFWAYVTLESVRAARAVKRLRAEAAPAEPNDTPLRRMAARWRGRVFRSQVTLLGLPLLDVNVSDPVPPGGTGRGDGPRVARGWIAIGDDARGVLLGVGSKARGFVAIGGRAVGVFSLGGVAVGLVAVGGLAFGVLAVGGLAVGGLALGGGGIGWQACGGGAVAWDTACGGGAVAWHAAYGGAAVAHDYAVGGEASAWHANDEAARAVLMDHPLKQGMEWFVANQTWFLAVIILVSLLPCAALPLMYRRERWP